jgi:hypothetical protein
MLSRIIQTVARKLRGAEAVPGRAVAEPAPIAPANEAVAVSPPIDIYAEHAKWMALAGQRDFDGAIELCLSTIKAPDTSFVASLFLGYAYFQSGRPSEAQRHLIPAVALNAGDFYANLLLAHVEKALGAPREALARYMTCCTLDAASVVEPFEAAMDIALPMREAEEGEALSTLFDKLHAADKLPDPLVLKFLFFWRRDADLVGLLVRAEEAGKPKASFRHVRTVQDWALAHGENYVSLGEPVSIRLVTPTETYRDAPKEKHVLGSAPYIAEVRNASIVGNSSLIYAGDADVLSDVLAHPLYGEQVSLAYDKTVIAQRSDALLLAQQGASERLDEGIMLSGLASNAYGHWFAEFLPKLRYFERNPRFEQLPIIVDAGMPQSHFDFLAALVGNPLHRIESGQVLEVGIVQGSWCSARTSGLVERRVHAIHQGQDRQRSEASWPALAPLVSFAKKQQLAAAAQRERTHRRPAVDGVRDGLHGRTRLRASSADLRRSGIRRGAERFRAEQPHLRCARGQGLDPGAAEQLQLGRLAGADARSRVQSRIP